MNRISTPIWAAMIALSGFIAGPAFAAAHGGGGGGGGHGGGFSGHAFGGGGHAFAGGHAYGGGYGGVRTAGYGGFAAHGYGGHFAGAVGYRGYGGYGYRGFRPWGGGYWGGAYWPRAYFGLGFAWFLPVLPLYYSTYWWDGVPYYYADDAYYTWSPSDGGYVATNPPPLAAGAPQDGAPPAGGPPPGPQAGPPPGAGPTASAGPEGVAPGGQRIFAYPKNNQTEEQQATDRRECEQWAAGQATGNSPADYRRAVIVCFEGRGYSAQ